MLKLYCCYCCVLLVEWIFSLPLLLWSVLWLCHFFFWGVKCLYIFKSFVYFALISFFFFLKLDSLLTFVFHELWIIGGIVANEFKFWEVVISPFSCFQVGSMGAEGYCVNIPWSQGGVGDNDYIFSFQHVVLPIG